jgi:hypothetical protein|tara:strand:- start:817 stop:966 length:150 start_codon:yes stop_codon:yes gene_type:complete
MIKYILKLIQGGIKERILFKNFTAETVNITEALRCIQLYRDNNNTLKVK